MIRPRNRINDFAAPISCNARIRYHAGLRPLTETKMKTTLISLLLLSLALTGCIIAPGPGYGDRGYYGGGHAGFYGEHGYENR